MGRLSLLLLLKLIPRLTPGMDTMVDTMDILTTDMDIGAERREKLRLSLLLLLKQIPRLTPGMDTMVDIMDTPMDITIMDIMVDMDTPILEDITMVRDLPKLSQKLIPRLIPGMDTMVDTMDTPMVITGAESK